MSGGGVGGGVSNMNNINMSNMPGAGSGNLFSALSSDNLGDTDFLNDFWDTPIISDSNVSSSGNMNSASYQNTVATTSSSTAPWMSQLRVSQVAKLVYV